MPAAVCTSGVARMARSYGAERSLLGAGDAGGCLHVRGRGHGALLRGRTLAVGGRVMPAAVCTSGVARMARSYGAEHSLLGGG